MAPTSQERLDDQQRTSSLDMNHLVGSLSKEETISIVNALGNPETEDIKELVKRIGTSIKDADDNRQLFLQHLDQKTFVSLGDCKRNGIAALAKFTDTWKAAIDLKDYARDFFSTRIKALERQYGDLKKQYAALKNKQAARAAPTAEMKQLSQQWEKIETLKKEYEAVQSRVNALLNDFADMMENKLDQHKAILYGKKYKHDRLFDKDAEEKIKIKAKKGNRRDPKNAAKYLGGSPTPDKGKCGITDAQSRVDKETMSEALQNARRGGGDKRTGIVERTPEAQKAIPAVDADIDQLITSMNALIGDIPALGVTLKAILGE